MSDNFTNSCTTLNHEQRREILFAMGLGGVVSAIVCLTALTLVVCLKLYKHFSHRLAAYQVVSALFFSVVCSVEMVVINYDSNPGMYRPVCEALGFLLEYAVWVKLLFMLWLTFHLFSFAVCYTSLEYHEILCVVSLTLSPLLFIWVPFVHGVYGLAGAWCWIQNWRKDCVSSKLTEGEIEQYGLFYVPAFVALVGAILLIIIMLVFLVCRTKLPSSELQPLISDAQRKQALRELLPLMAYPVLFCLFLFPSFVNRIYGTITKNASLASFMSSAVTTPCLSFFAGLTLIIHVIILKWPRASSSIAVNGRTAYVDGTMENHCHGVTPRYTSFTICSTNYRTRFSIPNESDVDESLLRKQTVSNAHS